MKNPETRIEKTGQNRSGKGTRGDGRKPEEM
jgi:hypothetical protein